MLLLTIKTYGKVFYASNEGEFISFLDESLLNKEPSFCSNLFILKNRSLEDKLSFENYKLRSLLVPSK